MTRALLSTVSGAPHVFIDDLNPSALDQRLATLRASSDDHGARIATVRVVEVTTEDPLGPDAIAAELARGTVSSPIASEETAGAE